MFERFSERARQVVVLAQEEARALKHNYIGTEHILLGLLAEKDGLAARVLESLDITVERVREQVVRIVGSAEEVTSGQIPFTPRAKKVLELALREALSLGHNYIGTEHILLGLVRENEGVAARILLDFDADSEKIRNEVIRLLPGEGPEGPAGRRRMRHVRLAWSGAEHPAPQPRAGIAEARSGVHEGSPLDLGGELMARLERQIQRRLHRDPDNGDLLVILSELPEGVVARALSELGVAPEALDAALQRARAEAPDDIDEQIARVRAAKDDALDAGRLEEAARHRERERALSAATAAESRLLERVRARLGLSEEEPSGEPEGG
jgi:hypothetical protein